MVCRGEKIKETDEILYLGYKYSKGEGVWECNKKNLERHWSCITEEEFYIYKMADCKEYPEEYVE
jgi:hypothetical protein